MEKKVDLEMCEHFVPDLFSLMTTVTFTVAVFVGISLVSRRVTEGV